MARASAFQAEGRGFESRFPLHYSSNCNAHIAQEVEHFLGKEEVSGSSPDVGSTRWCGNNGYCPFVKKICQFCEVDTHSIEKIDTGGYFDGEGKI